MTTLTAHNLMYVVNRRTILDRVHLVACPGEVLVLIGPNGAGKTTLLRAMARLLAPSGGAVSLDGRHVWQLAPRAVARQLAFTPQDGDGASSLTVGQIVALGRAPHRGWLLPLSADDRAAVERAMARTGVLPFRERLLSELSGGEQRRVILARALAQEPRALLLDEPTAHLDLKYQVELLDMVRCLAHRDGLTVVVTLHDLNQAAQFADRAALLAEGQILAVGAPAAVLSPALLSQAYGTPVIVVSHPVYGTPLVVPLSKPDEEKQQ
ncbi:MAG: ABC transporter ATP-binding protein [Chloroflexales bacterium]|nr:ABC transporter ATP-binding protein [Chloroflexales bacterium]